MHGINSVKMSARTQQHPASSATNPFSYGSNEIMPFCVYPCLWKVMHSFCAAFMQTGGRMLSIWAACGRSCTFLQPSRARTALRSARRLTRTVTRTLTRAIVMMSWSWAPLPRCIALCTCGKRALDAWEDACFCGLYMLMLMSGVKEVLIPPSGVPNKGSVFVSHRPLMSMVDQHCQPYSSLSLRPGCK